MAVRIDAAADRLLRTAVLNHNAAYTWMGWFYFTSLPTTRASNALAFDDNGTANMDYFQIDAASTHHIEWGQSIGGSFVARAGSTVISTGTWYHIALVRASVTSLQGYLNGVAEGALVTTTVTGRAAATRMEMGAYNTSNTDWMDGRIAYVMAWDRALSASEVINEMRSVRPLQPLNLWGFWPLWPNQRVKDLSGNGRDWTEGGTLTDEDPPPVWFGGLPRVSLSPASAGDATLSAGVATATALSPTSAITGGAVLTANAATATALSPTATIAAGAVLSANAATATALSPTATVTGGAILTAQAATATALSPVATITAASAGTLVAGVATATALSPDAVLSGGSLLSAGAALATALAPGATFTTGAVISAGAATATASAPVASITGGGPPSAVVPRCPVTVRTRNLTMHARSRSFGIRAPRRSFALTVRNC